MPDSNSSGGPSFYEQIKDSIPMIADTAIGGLVGGTAGAALGFAGEAEAEGKADDQRNARMDKMAQFVMRINEQKSRAQQQAEYHKDYLKQQAQMHSDNEDMKKLQMLMSNRQHQDAQLQQLTEFKIREQDSQQFRGFEETMKADEMGLRAMTVSAGHVSEGDYQSWLGKQSKDIQDKGANLPPSGDARKTFMDSIIRSNVANSPGVQASALKQLSDRTGMSPDELLKRTKSASGKDLQRLLARSADGDFKTPASFDKAIDQLEKQHASFAGDIEKGVKEYNKSTSGIWDKIFKSDPGTLNIKKGLPASAYDGAASAILKSATADAHWSSLTQQERQNAQKKIAQGMAAGITDPNDLATLAWPDGLSSSTVGDTLESNVVESGGSGAPAAGGDAGSEADKFMAKHGYGGAAK